MKELKEYLKKPKLKKVDISSIFNINDIPAEELNKQYVDYRFVVK